MTTKVLPFRAPQNDSHSSPNSPEALAFRVRSNQLPWARPLVMTFIRLPLILVGQLLTWAYYTVTDHSNSWMAAVGMTNVYLPLTADLGCVLLLIWLLHREKITFSDLVHSSRSRLLRDTLIGFGLLLVTLILFQVTSLLSSVLVYGPSILSATRSSAIQTDISMPPLWVAWWSLLVLPISVGIVEELTYRGYVLPRLIVLTGRTWLALLIMAIGFGLQHIALPLIEWRTSLSRFISTFLMGIFFGWVYIRQKRLLPLMIAHWGLDFVGLGLLSLLWALSS